MKSNYKKIGKYIQPVNIRNKELEVDTLLGVSIKKILIPSIANTVGTNMKTYKVIKRNQFAYGPVTSRNGDKVSIALLEEHDVAIVSQAYTVFEVIDETELDPEYLMMWFRRPEFDRYARFKSHGSAREIFDWNELRETELPIPSIEKQREIVKEYNTVVNRIKLNEQLNQKLEEAAQALYKHWFVDFEFPVTKESHPELVSGSPELEGKPYKSTGGAMVYNEELEKDIPVGWEIKGLGEVATITAGGDKPKIFSENETLECNIPIYSNSTVKDGLFGFSNKSKVKDNSVTISARGGIGFTSLRSKPYVPIVRLINVIPNEIKYLNYIFHFLSIYEYSDIASAQAQLTKPDVESFKLIYANKRVSTKFQVITDKLYSRIVLNKDIIEKTLVLKNLLLSKMTKVEEKEIA
jgi:type I restriction enzyme, S subunit